jgi:hypothetical protein
LNGFLPVTKPSGQSVFLAAVLIGSAMLLGYLALTGDGFAENQRAGGQGKPGAKLTLNDIPFDGAAAYEYLKGLCQFGPRRSGTEAMTKQQKYLEDHFKRLGGHVTRQEFRARHPISGQPVEMANLIIQWHPKRQDRVLLCAHYDTRPFPDRDRRRPRGRFIGANDGASGVAVLMELGKRMPALEGRYGVDFVLFDGEELVYREGDAYFLGSEYFAKDYANDPPEHYRYRWGVLLDMVGDKDLLLPKEGHSVQWEDTRPLVDDIWRVAGRLGVSEFVPQVGATVLDDHIKLHDVAGIPTCDIIDFDFEHWHTEQDVPQNCSALSLAKVGWVVEEWIKGLK